MIYNYFILFRALCGRIEKTLQGLPPPYKLNRPNMYSVTSSETRHPTRSPTFAVNWTTGTNSVEVLNTTTGKAEHGMSNICKQIFMHRFMVLCKAGLSTISGIHTNLPQCYCDVKEAIPSYVVRMWFLHYVFIYTLY